MASIKRIGRDKSGVPIWEAVYRRTPGGKQVRRRFHAESKAEVERAVLLDSNKSGIGLKWSEGVRIYLDAKRVEGCTPESMEHVERAGSVFISIMGDIDIEKTTPETMKEFMQSASRQPVKHRYSGKEFRLSGPKVANHHCKELLTVARYLRNHTGKILEIPFEHVPPLPVKAGSRSPIQTGMIQTYLDALPPHVLRPIQMILYYGLRSTAACNLMTDSISGKELAATDKGGVKRHIPIDGLLSGIIERAEEFRGTFKKDAERRHGIPADNLFLNANGRGWNRMTLLHAAQRAWERAGLEKKKIHEIRHTLGTLAGKSFTPGMVQAAMGHRSRKSAEAYFHPTEEIAAEVRQKIITEISQKVEKSSEDKRRYEISVEDKNGTFTCPCCHASLYFPNKKPQPATSYGS